MGKVTRIAFCFTKNRDFQYDLNAMFKNKNFKTEIKENAIIFINGSIQDFYKECEQLAPMVYNVVYIPEITSIHSLGPKINKDKNIGLKFMNKNLSPLEESIVKKIISLKKYLQEQDLEFDKTFLYNLEESLEKVSNLTYHQILQYLNFWERQIPKDEKLADNREYAKVQITIADGTQQTVYATPFSTEECDIITKGPERGRIILTENLIMNDLKTDTAFWKWSWVAKWTLDEKECFMRIHFPTPVEVLTLRKQASLLNYPYKNNPFISSYKKNISPSRLWGEINCQLVENFGEESDEESVDADAREIDYDSGEDQDDQSVYSEKSVQEEKRKGKKRTNDYEDEEIIIPTDKKSTDYFLPYKMIDTTFAQLSACYETIESNFRDVSNLAIVQEDVLEEMFQLCTHALKYGDKAKRYKAVAFLEYIKKRDDLKF